MAQKAIRFWENWHRATKYLSRKERGEFLCKVTDYAFEGIEPKITQKEGPAWEFIKVAIDESLAGQEAGIKGGRGKRNKPHAETPSENPHEKPPTKTPSFIETETETETELQTERESERPGFSYACLAAFNEETGSTYATLPVKVERFMDRMGDSHTVDEVRAMVRYKRDEWQGTEFARNLTPQTLFSADHFEQYIHQSQMPPPKRKPKEVKRDADFERLIAGI